MHILEMFHNGVMYDARSVSDCFHSSCCGQCSGLCKAGRALGSCSGTSCTALYAATQMYALLASACICNEFIMSCIALLHQVDRSIDEMRALGIVRVLSIPFYPKDVFITLSEHYREDIRAHYSAQEGGDTATQVMLKLLEADVTTSVGDADVHAAFESVSSGHTDEVRATASIGSRKRARSEVSGETQTRSEAERASSLRGLSAFLLPRRDVQTDHMYYYTHPQVTHP